MSLLMNVLLCSSDLTWTSDNIRVPWKNELNVQAYKYFSRFVGLHVNKSKSVLHERKLLLGC